MLFRMKGGKMKIVHLSEIEKKEISMEGAKGVSKQLPISGKDGSPAYTFRIFTIRPGGNTSYHAHGFEHINYVIEGQAVIVNEQEGEHAVAKGDFILVLPFEKHQYKNTSSDKDFVMICAVPNEYD